MLCRVGIKIKKPIKPNLTRGGARVQSVRVSVLSTFGPELGMTLAKLPVDEAYVSVSLPLETFHLCHALPTLTLDPSRRHPPRK